MRILIALCSFAIVACSHTPDSMTNSSTMASFHTDYTLGSSHFMSSSLPGVELPGMQTQVILHKAIAESPGPISPVSVPRD